MVVASFLVKDLHLHWRRGARYFIHHLRDGDLASDQHGWQWVAGCATDPAPWFRIFNPVRQGAQHDPHGEYVRRWVPELGEVPGPRCASRGRCARCRPVTRSGSSTTGPSGRRRCPLRRGAPLTATGPASPMSARRPARWKARLRSDQRRFGATLSRAPPDSTYSLVHATSASVAGLRSQYGLVPFVR